MSTSASDDLATFGSFTPQRIRPIAAVAAGIRLFLNNQDTKQVGLLDMAMGGYANEQVFARFIQSDAGRAALRERHALVKLLDDHEYLQSLPENSLGRRYVDHMSREGLTVQGLLDATSAVNDYIARQPEAVGIFINYAIRCGHDLHHVLGGYGRDELGEMCVLAMSYEQLKVRGYKVMFTFGPFAVRRQLRRLNIDPSGIFAAVREASEIGRQAAWLPGLDIAGILAEDIDALRAGLNIREPVRYHEIISRIRAGSAWKSGPLVHVPTPP